VHCFWQTNLCRGILSSLLREVFTSMDDVHQARRTELEHRSKAAQSVGCMTHLRGFIKAP
jgi:hypothetical protein